LAQVAATRPAVIDKAEAGEIAVDLWSDLDQSTSFVSAILLEQWLQGEPESAAAHGLASCGREKD